MNRQLKQSVYTLAAILVAFVFTAMGFAGDTHFGYRGFTEDPRYEYHEMADGFKIGFKMTPEQMRAAEAEEARLAEMRRAELAERAADLARQMERQKVGIYSFTRTYGEMLPVETFLDHIARAQQMGRDQAGAPLSRRRDGDIIEPDPQEPMGLLMTVNF